LIGERAIVTSANLTEAGLNRNHELGFVCEGGKSARACRQHFDVLWDLCEPDLTEARLDEFQDEIDRFLARRGGRVYIDLPDEGADAGGGFLERDQTHRPAWFDEPPASFVKFFGRNIQRLTRSDSIRTEIRRSGCSVVCSYPKNKRPWSVETGSTMFVGRLVKNPNDILIFGRAVAIAYEPGRDDASAADIGRRQWRAQWSRYIRVHHGQFLAGTFANGVSLNELMRDLGADSFASTQAHREAGDGNTNPRSAYPRQPHVRLSPQGRDWVTERLEAAFDVHGVQDPQILAGIG
jgi:hypothetical protein